MVTGNITNLLAATVFEAVPVESQEVVPNYWSSPESETSKYLFETKIKEEKIWHFTRIKPTEGLLAFSLDHIHTVTDALSMYYKNSPYPPYPGMPQSFDHGLVNYFPIPSGMGT